MRSGRLTPTRLWLQLLVVAAIASAGAVHYQLQSQQPTTFDAGLQRLDLLYLRQPAPGLSGLGVKYGAKAVVIFCQSCRSPVVKGAQVLYSTDKGLANEYGLISKTGAVGPGYAIIDSQGQVRYRSFDANLVVHGGEISRLVKGVQ